MHLFTDYIQPLTLWLHTHPDLALLITFLISFAESLAIIGSIVPGSVTMTAIGILAGSGVMRIDLTFLAAALGAVAGDTGSYALGYKFSDRLVNIWPFNRYPTWLSYGKDFFVRHGSTSVLVGRFVGPMRSIIPVIAGMMHMNHWHFLLANIISAIGWSLLYVLPGVLIGLASSELSTESATRLFVLILVVLVVLWVSSLAIKWLLIHTNQLLRSTLHNVWMSLKKHPRLASYATHLAPNNELNHYPTAALCLLAVVCFFMSVVLVMLITQDVWITSLNSGTYFFLQSLRTQFFDIFFIIIGLIVQPTSSLTLLVAFALYTIYYHDWRTLKYWLSIGLMSSFVIFLIEPSSEVLYRSPAFPAIDLTLSTSLFTFLTFYISKYQRTITLLTMRAVLLLILLLAGIAIMYLGDKWLSGVLASYFIGSTISLIHWIFYRRSSDINKRSQLLIVFSLASLALATFFYSLFYLSELIRAHSTHPQQYEVTEETWWNQRQPLLPIYSTNRIGRRMGLLNIQYVGSINKLVSSLEAHGWKPQSSSFFYSLLLRAGGQYSSEEVPLTAQIYLNKTPLLTMTYKISAKNNLLILRLWRSNYHLSHHQEPIWIGSISPGGNSKKISNKWSNHAASVHDYIIQALPGFNFNKHTVSKQYLKPLPYPAPGIILNIKEPMHAN